MGQLQICQQPRNYKIGTKLSFKLYSYKSIKNQWQSSSKVVTIQMNPQKSEVKCMNIENNTQLINTHVSNLS